MMKRGRQTGTYLNNVKKKGWGFYLTKTEITKCILSWCYMKGKESSHTGDAPASQWDVEEEGTWGPFLGRQQRGI